MKIAWVLIILTTFSHLILLPLSKDLRNPKAIIRFVTNTVDPCFEQDMDYYGNGVGFAANVRNEMDCRDLCQQNPKCVALTFVSERYEIDKALHGNCYLKSKKANLKPVLGLVSGLRTECDLLPVDGRWSAWAYAGDSTGMKINRVRTCSEVSNGGHNFCQYDKVSTVPELEVIVTGTFNGYTPTQIEQFFDAGCESESKNFWLGDIYSNNQIFEFVYSSRRKVLAVVLKNARNVQYNNAGTRMFKIEAKESETDEWNELITGTLASPIGKSCADIPEEIFSVGGEVYIKHVKFTCLDRYDEHCSLKYISFLP